MSEDTARNFMRVASVYGGKSGIIPDLAPTALYELVAPSTSKTVREAILLSESPLIVPIQSSVRNGAISGAEKV